MTTPDQREHLRYEVEWEVEVSTESWEDVLTLTTTSVSRGGLFIKASRPAHKGAPVQVSLHLPDGNTVKLVGDVVRTVEPDAPGLAPGFAIKFDPDKSSDLVLLESMASAFGTPEPGEPSRRTSSIKASVITRQVSKEESAISIDDAPEGEAPPPDSGAAKHSDTDAPSAFAPQPTVQRQPSPDEIAASKHGEQPETRGDRPSMDGIPITIDIVAEPPESFSAQPTTDAIPPLDRAADKQEESGSYDVGEQIRLAMTGDITEAPVSPDSKSGRSEEWIDEHDRKAAKADDAAAQLPPLGAQAEESSSRPTVEAPAAEKGTVEAPAAREKRPTREAPAVASKKPTRETEAVSEPAAQAAAEPSRHSLPPIEERGEGDEALAFGIDFGTSYTSIGLFYEGAVAVLEDDEGHPLVPSAVSYPEQGLPLVGWAAREKLATQPSTTFTSPKRVLGRDYYDQNIQPFLASSAARFDQGPGGQLVADVFGQPVTIIQIAAEIFRQIIKIGEARAGRPVRKVALAAPVAFEEQQRSAITRAAEMSGLEVVAYIDEPVAAAVAYGASGDEEQLVAVYDFGGGTFDFTLLKAGGGSFDVLGEAGDAWLGGDDFDLALANHVADAFFKKKKVDLRKRQVEWQRLLFLCERAKRQLTRSEETVVEGKGMALSLRGAVDLSVEIDRSLFAELCSDLVERSIDTMETCFMLTGEEPDAVSQVVMTGGVSRIPMVRERVEGFFNRDIPLTVNPEEAIVIGTARFARQAAGIFREGR